jgi:hypothetical protein
MILVYFKLCIATEFLKPSKIIAVSTDVDVLFQFLKHLCDGAFFLI